MTHILYSQIKSGIPVFGAFVAVHVSSGSQDDAITSGIVPYLSRSPKEILVISPDEALRVIREVSPEATITISPTLYYYPYSLSEPIRSLDGQSLMLAWIGEAIDGIRDRTFVISASTGQLMRIIDKTFDVKNREVHDGTGISDYTGLPGKLIRNEGDPQINDKDADSVFQYLGASYDYYKSAHNRDSYDDKGGKLVATVHFDPVKSNAAAWIPSLKQMAYAPGTVVLDVTAHELTHGVSNLAVDDGSGFSSDPQSSALNESISDMFAAMVDRSNWLIGEGLPSEYLRGRDAIRDMSNPERLGDPGNTKDWVSSCTGDKGAHNNANITNKAYYNIATSITKDKAERVLYRTLTTYLHGSSGFSDFRAAFIKSATDLYGATTVEVGKVKEGFDAVGLTEGWQPPNPNCSCSAAVALQAPQPQNVGEPTIGETIVALYRLREDVMSTTSKGVRLRELYETYSGRMSNHLLADSSLRSAALKLIVEARPGLQSLSNETNVVLTADVVHDAVSFLDSVATRDRLYGDGSLATLITKERSRIDASKLIGMTYSEAWAYVANNLGIDNSFLPIISK